MKKSALLLMMVFFVMGCSNKEYPKTEDTLKTEIINTWIFPETSSYDRLEITSEGWYELFEKKAYYASRSFIGTYRIEGNLKTVTLDKFGSFEIHSSTSNSLHIVLCDEDKDTREEVTLTAKVVEKLLPNKEKHLSKIINFQNIFYPKDLVNAVYSGDKLYRYTKYLDYDKDFSSQQRILSVFNTKSEEVVSQKQEYTDFVYSADKVSFSYMYYKNSVTDGRGTTRYVDCNVSLDSEGRASRVSISDYGVETVLNYKYTTDGYIDAVIIGDNGNNGLKYTYEGGNPVKCVVSLGEETATVEFSDYTVENKSSFDLPVFMLTEIEEALQAAGLLGKSPKMLPKMIKQTNSDFPDEVYQARLIYETDSYGMIKKLNIQMFAFDEEEDKEYVENILNYEYQYK